MTSRKRVNRLSKKTAGKTYPKKRGVFPFSITYPPKWPENRLGRPTKAVAPVPKPPDEFKEELKHYLGLFRRYWNPTPMPDKEQLRKWERTFREAANNLPKIEPFIRYNGGPIDYEINRRRGMQDGVDLLKEVANYLRDLHFPDGGAPTTDFDVAWCVSLLCDAYRRQTKRPYYNKVGKLMYREFPELFSEKKQWQWRGRLTGWARERYRFWKRLQKDPERQGRVRKEQTRREVLLKLSHGGKQLPGAVLDA